MRLQNELTGHPLTQDEARATESDQVLASGGIHLSTALGAIRRSLSLRFVQGVHQQGARAGAAPPMSPASAGTEAPPLASLCSAHPHAPWQFEHSAPRAKSGYAVQTGENPSSVDNPAKGVRP